VTAKINFASLLANNTAGMVSFFKLTLVFYSIFPICFGSFMFASIRLRKNSKKNKALCLMIESCCSIVGLGYFMVGWFVVFLSRLPVSSIQAIACFSNIVIWSIPLARDVIKVKKLRDGYLSLTTEGKLGEQE
jgi:hypothetical protein